MPSHTICPTLPATEGKTRPGQSQRMRAGTSGTKSVWKCFVFPGVEETLVFFSATITLTVDDLPTFG